MNSSYMLTLYLWFHIFKLQLNYLKDFLKRLRDHVAFKHPNFYNLLVLIPSPNGIDPQKNLAHSVRTTDTCHTANLVCTTVIENFGYGVLQKNCHNHLQNVWVGGLEKELYSYLTNLLRSSIYEIDPTLREKLYWVLLRVHTTKAYLYMRTTQRVLGICSLSGLWIITQGM